MTVRDWIQRFPPLVLDAALAAVVAVSISFAIGAEQEEGSKHPDALAYLLGVAIAAPLLVRDDQLIAGVPGDVAESRRLEIASSRTAKAARTKTARSALAATMRAVSPPGVRARPATGSSPRGASSRRARTHMGRGYSILR